MALRKPLVIDANSRTANLPSGDKVSASDMDISGLTAESSILDTDELVIQKTAAGTIKKVLWSVLKAASRALGLTSGQIPFSDGTNLIGSANLSWNDTTKSLTIKGSSSTDGATLGAELLTTTGWTVGAGWTESPDDTFAHSSGVETLTHSAIIANATKYQLTYTITGRTAGTITISFGGMSVVAAGTNTFGPTTASTSGFVVTPTTDFNGTVVLSLKAITSASTALLSIKNVSGSPTEIRYGSVDTNLFIGRSAGGFVTTGAFNNCVSNNAQQNLTTGSFNNAIGVYSQINLSTGFDNCAFGHATQLSLTAGSNNMAIGSYAQYSLTTGINNSAIGHSSLYSLTTGFENSAFGYNAGRYAGAGTTVNQTSTYSTYIGNSSRAGANGNTNEIVIGNNTAGLGSNTTVIGNSSTTLTGLYGDLALGGTTASAKIHALKTTEQLRLGYDATKFASFTVNSAGSLAIDPVAKLDISGATAYNVGKAVDFEVGDGVIGWRDLVSDIILRGVVATDPVWAQIGTSPFWGYKTTIGKKVWITFHINHDYYPGGQILLHTHWISSGTDTTNAVKWQFTYSVIKGHNQTGGDLSTTGTVVSAQTVSGGQYRHMISEIASSIVVTNAEVDSLIMVMVERVTNGATNNTNDIFLITADCHYQASRFATPQRAPNFYN